MSVPRHATAPRSGQNTQQTSKDKRGTYLVVPVAEAGHVLADGEGLAGEVGVVVDDALGVGADADRGDGLLGTDLGDVGASLAEAPDEGLEVGVAVDEDLTGPGNVRLRSPRTRKVSEA